MKERQSKPLTSQKSQERILSRVRKMRVSDSAPKLRIRTLRGKGSKTRNENASIGRPKIKRKRLIATPRSLVLKNETPVKRLDHRQKQTQSKPNQEEEKPKTNPNTINPKPMSKIPTSKAPPESLVKLPVVKERPNAIIDIHPTPPPCPSQKVPL